MASNISRRSFLKGMTGVAGAAALGLLTGTSRAFAEGTTISAFKAGTYSSIQKTPYAEVKVTCVFSETSLTDVSYEVLQSANGDYFTPFANAMQSYCQRIVETGRTDGVDGVSGATFSTTAIREGVNECTLLALGISVPAKREVLNPQDPNFDSFDSDLAEVFAPVQLGSMTLPNRVIKAAGSKPSPDFATASMDVDIELYGTMAANGVSLNILNGGVIAGYAIQPHELYVDDVDAKLTELKRLVDGVHENGGKIGFQLCYGGTSPYASDAIVNDPTIEDLEAFLDDVAESARRAKQIGFDCIEIKGASADALNGFLSRRMNRREDEYGPQSVENRSRLFCNMIRTIKETNGADFPVGALINGVEENDVSLGDTKLHTKIEESQGIAKCLVAAGADWIQVRAGANNLEANICDPDMQHIIPGQNGFSGTGGMFDYTSHYDGMVDGSHSGFGSYLPIVKAIKKVVNVPVGCAAYLDLRVGPDYINDAIAKGELDLVFMNRPLNADPELVQKMKEGRREDVIPCAKCLHCHDWITSGFKRPCTCRMNPTTYISLREGMPEGRIPLPAETSRNIMVVGAGPAGMEAARVAAERGHKVTVYEKSEKIGGLINFAHGVKGDHERFGDYLKYIAHQLDKNGVEVNLYSNVTVDTVKEQNPDAVVVAVGGKRVSKLSSSSSVPVYSPDEAFGDSLGETVAILGVNVQAIDFATYLLSMGKKVVLVNPDAEDAFDAQHSAWYQIYNKSFLETRGARIFHNAEVLNVVDDGIEIKTAQGFEKFVPCNCVVEFYDMTPNTELAEEIQAAGYEVVCVGDCSDPFNIQRAIYSGHMAARAL